MKLKHVVPSLAALFSFSVVNLVGQYISLLYGGWTFPVWLFAVIFLVSFESVYFSAFFLSPRTPITVRLLEVGSAVGAVYVIVRLTLSPLAYEWFELSQAIRDPYVILPALLTLAAWFMAGGYGQQFTVIHKLGDQLGDASASTVSWEYESLESRDYGVTMAIEYFFWRLFGYGFLIGVLAIAASRSGVVDDLSRGYRLGLGVLGIGGLSVGLILQGAVYLFRLETIWSYTGTRVSEGFQKDWFKNLAIFVIAVVGIVSIAPVNYSPITYDRLSQWAIGLFQGMDPFTVIEGDFQPESPPHSNEEMVEWGIGEEEPSFWFALVMFLYFLVVVGGIALLVLLAVGFFLVMLAKDELDKLKGMPQLAVRIYRAFTAAVCGGLMALRDLWGRGKNVLRRYTFSPTDTLSAERTHKAGKKRGPSGPVLHIRQMFQRIVRTGREVGIRMGPGQTPQEYGELLREKLPSVNTEIQFFIQSYNEVRYGKRMVEPEWKERVMEQGQEIVRQIKAWGKEEQ